MGVRMAVDRRHGGSWEKSWLGYHVGCHAVTILDRMTASAITTPHRHFSHTSCRHPAANPDVLLPLASEPAPAAAAAVPGVTFRASLRGRATAETFLSIVALGVDVVEGVVLLTILRVGGTDGATVAVTAVVAGRGVSGIPLSFSPMFGGSLAIGVQYCPEKRCQHAGPVTDT